MKSAKDRIEELEAEVEELRGRLEANELAPELDQEPEEEVKQEEDIATKPVNVEELARMLNCDTNNQEEMKSIELAMQLEAEERRQHEENLQRILQVQQQTLALHAMGSNDPRAAGNLNPDVMTYEQLLELEEKIGSVSKGLPLEKIGVRKIRLFTLH